MLAFDDLAEAAHCVRNLHVLALEAGKLLGHVEGLREEALHLAGAGDGEFVVFAELVNAQNGDDVLQVAVALQDPLHALRHIVMLLANDARIENARSGSQRIHRRIDSDLRQRPAEHGSGIKVGKRGCGRGIGKIIGRNVNRLHRSDRPFLGRSNAFLQLAHFRGEIRLISHRRGHAAQQRRNF